MPKELHDLSPGATFTGLLKEDDPLLRMQFVVLHRNHPLPGPGNKPGKSTPQASQPGNRKK